MSGPSVSQSKTSQSTTSTTTTSTNSNNTNSYNTNTNVQSGNTGLQGMDLQNFLASESNSFNNALSAIGSVAAAHSAGPLVDYSGGGFDDGSTSSTLSSLSTGEKLALAVGGVGILYFLTKGK